MNCITEKELKGRVAALGLIIEEENPISGDNSGGDVNLNILDREGYCYATVSKDKMYRLDTDCRRFSDLGGHTQSELLWTLVTYSRTPIEERVGLDKHDDSWFFM